jgi:hypothetical protein
MMDKPYLWQYWDNIDNNKTPAYIELCLETVNNNCSKNFNIVRLNKDNIKKYLPELNKYQNKLDKLIIAHKVDIYRIMLLYKYGGIYMDCDIIVLRDPIEIINKLEFYDFVGFGCTGSICQYGYGHPSNWILASKKNTKLMKNILDTLLNKIETQDKFEYHDLGKMVIWKELKKLISNENYTYYHYPNKIDGTRDKNGYWITSNRIFSDKEINYEDEDNMMFLILYNSNIGDNIKKMSKERLLSEKNNYVKFINKGLSH